MLDNCPTVVAILGGGYQKWHRSLFQMPQDAVLRQINFGAKESLLSMAVTSDRFGAGLHTKVTANAAVEVKGIQRCHGVQTSTSLPEFVSTNAAIENDGVKADGASAEISSVASQIASSDSELTAASAVREQEAKSFSEAEAEFETLWILSNVRSRSSQKEMAKKTASLQKNLENKQHEQRRVSSHCSCRYSIFSECRKNRNWWRSCRAGNRATMTTVSCLLLLPQLTKATALTSLMC